MASKKPNTTTQPVKIIKTLKPPQSKPIHWDNIDNILETYKKEGPYTLEDLRTIFSNYNRMSLDQLSSAIVSSKWTALKKIL